MFHVIQLFCAISMGALLGFSNMHCGSCSVLPYRLPYTPATSFETTEIRCRFQYGVITVHAGVSQGFTAMAIFVDRSSVSFTILQGPIIHLKHVCTKERLPFTITYVVSLGLTLFFAIGVRMHHKSRLNLINLISFKQRRSYIPTLVCSLIQVIALVSYFLAYFPWMAFEYFLSLYALITSTIFSGGLATLQFGGRVALRGATNILPV